MYFTTTSKKIASPFILMGLLLLLSSCGAYQYVGYDNDGIYSSDEVVVEVEEAATNRTNDNYYANYFAQFETEAQLAQQESEIFTDVDTYSSGNAAIDDVEIIEDYGGWGQVNDQVVINYYNTGWNNWGWGWNDPWLWNGGFGWGWNNWGWGWNRWNAGFGWGWGLNNPWAWNGGFGWGWNNWGWNNGFYRNNGVAFNRSRRGVYNSRLAYGNTTRNGVSRRNAYGTSRRNVRGATTRSNRSGINSSRIRTNRGTSVRPRRGTVTRPSRGSTTRSSRGVMPSRGNTTRSSRGSSRSSGSMRSSRGSSRSSGSMRSGGGSRSSGGSRGGGSRGGGRRG